MKTLKAIFLILSAVFLAPSINGEIWNLYCSVLFCYHKIKVYNHGKRN